ncbi:hypothetical protein Poli38472_002319 [Pythium oligandrum]|uniref:Uncharacterized protein n=1 Tax=Pythium oligandrum TaxID=41045 RepID=A0A8K1CI35_PYTOL|nr:hypothetical protein Poli38472_002319 [Pythium oligandrum]|eukprot:TMW63378.1 hypothetical protein Poli38472_002319 [Pythium oligandrum]
MSAMASGVDAGQRAFISYYTPHRLYGLCWGTKATEFRLATSTFIPGEYVNKLQVLQPSQDGQELVRTLEIDHPYPPTKVMWSPQSFGNNVEYLATTADYLRIWAVKDTSLERHATISNKRNQETCAPLTSFDWNEAEPSMIGTSSIDTTCTIWDLNNISAPKQQIIAHDDEVYDMAFSPEANIFGSVGGDGSLRLFDLRSLESSTIVYETPELRPLLRIAWNKQDDRFVATMIAGSPKVVILDLRNVSRPMFELNQHSASVNSICWSPHSRSHICSAGEDRTAILYDISSAITSESQSDGAPGLSESQTLNATTFFSSKSPINQIRWSPTQPSCVAICDEDATHVVQLL